MDDGSMNFLGAASRPPMQLPPQFTALSSIATSQTEIEPLDLVCSEDSSSLGVYRSFRVSQDAVVDLTNLENSTNFCMGNSGEFLHKVLFHLLRSCL
jgi:hypothetical protein